MLIQKYSICLISFFYLYEFFLAFIFSENIESLVDNLLGVKIFNLFYSFTFSILPSSGDMSDKPSSFSFCLLNFFVSAIFSSGGDLLFDSSLS